MMDSLQKCLNVTQQSQPSRYLNDLIDYATLLVSTTAHYYYLLLPASKHLPKMLKMLRVWLNVFCSVEYNYAIVSI